MRVLVIGASGFVGSALVEAFAGQAVGTYFQRPRPGLLPLDMRHPEAVRRVVSETESSCILVPAAQPHVDWCEDHEEESYDTNVRGPAVVAEVARTVGARVVFFSTDYVFDGTEGPYDETARPAPINVYGKHKLEAEQRVLGADPKNLVVRICGVYGYENPAKNFVMTLLRRLRAGEEVRVPCDQWGTPTYVRDIAATVRTLVEREASGVCHVAGPDYLPRHEFAQYVCTEFGLDRSQLHPLPTSALGQRARRPLHAGLRGRLMETWGIFCRGVVAGIGALAAEIEEKEGRFRTEAKSP